MVLPRTKFEVLIKQAEGSRCQWLVSIEGFSSGPDVDCCNGTIRQIPITIIEYYGLVVKQFLDESCSADGKCYSAIHYKLTAEHQLILDVGIIQLRQHFVFVDHSLYGQLDFQFAQLSVAVSLYPHNFYNDHGNEAQNRRGGQQCVCGS